MGQGFAVAALILSLVLVIALLCRAAMAVGAALLSQQENELENPAMKRGTDYFCRTQMEKIS